MTLLLTCTVSHLMLYMVCWLYSDRSLESLVRQDPSVTLAFLQGAMGKDVATADASSPTAVTTTPTTLTISGSGSSMSMGVSSTTPATATATWSRDLVANEEAMLKKEATSGRTERKTASRLDSLPYFETLCRLYDELCPQLLSPFVKVITDLCPTSETSGKEMHRQQQPVLSMDGIAPAGKKSTIAYAVVSRFSPNGLLVL
jgi:hypothetical protein